MQNTRLSTLIEQFSGRFTVFLRNPWRRLSLMIISLLGGNFLATILSTVAGQNADLDVLVSLLLVAFAEVVSWLVYGGDRRRMAANQRVLLIEILNGTKLGLTYGLFVEAFKLGS
ncbi:MAG: DUF565 domain-containing protein [Cyanobacteria bacterium RM1_2_2]|nr:DUF565 domain-containing protein [Cyanobacteria bacterium RM1_2_2]